jgi:hypothetical protein
VKFPLANIAKVRSGVAFREAIRHVEGAPIAIVQAGDIGADGLVDPAKLLRVSAVPVQGGLPKLAPGEVLLQSRGQTYRAGLVPHHVGPMVATASVLVITPGAAVRPSYLAHYLNDPVTQAELRALATGATIANLKKSELEKLEVLMPSLEDQEKIVALGEALRQQSRIEARLAELRRIQLRTLLEGRAKRNRGR